MAFNTNGKRAASASQDHDEQTQGQPFPRSILKRTDSVTLADTTSTTAQPIISSNTHNSATTKVQESSSVNEEDLSPNASRAWAKLFTLPKKTEEQRLAEDEQRLKRSDKLYGPLRASLLKWCPEWGK